MADQDDGEHIKKAYARLSGLKEGMKPDKDGWLEGAQAEDYNKALDHLMADGFDVDEFRVQGKDIEDIWGRRVVRANTLVTRVNQVLNYFTIKVVQPKDPDDPPSRRIGFEGPRRSS